MLLAPNTLFSGRPHAYLKARVLEHKLESPGGLVPAQTAGPPSGVSDSVGLVLEPNDLYL